MIIVKDISKFNHKKGQTSRIKYIVIHYTGSKADAKQQTDYFASGDRGASAHYFVGFKGDIRQSVEDSDIAWHVGSKMYKHPYCRNNNSIGIELCSKTNASVNVADANWYFEDPTIKMAVELTKSLMKKYKIPIENVLRHYDVTGKCCPAPFVFNTGKHTWDEFKKALMGEEVKVSKKESTDNAKKIWDYLKGKGFNEYAVAGIMGNLYAESGLNPINLQNSFEKKLGKTDEEYTKAVDSGLYTEESFIKDKAGYGLAQWTFWTRKKALIEYAKKHGKSIGDLDMQLEFFYKELYANPVLYRALKNSKSVKNASDAILHNYERPKDQSKAVEEKRASYGLKFYEQYADGSNGALNISEEFKVKVDIDYLNIRKGPGMNYDKTGAYTGRGVFTIVETSGNWGRLKSPVGWICLDYAEKL